MHFLRTYSQFLAISILVSFTNAFSPPGIQQQQIAQITGGNSGSPVLNNRGELIGLAFDGNYEALSHKLAFDKDLNRTICVDIRYVLWCIDKLGGAPHLINELTLAK